MTASDQAVPDRPDTVAAHDPDELAMLREGFARYDGGDLAWAPSMGGIRAALAALAERDAEIERLRAEAADVLVRQTNLRKLSIEGGAAMLDLDPPRELLIAWVMAARKMLGDAPNYTETRVDVPAASASMEIGGAGEERYVLTVQRAGKVTPHEARARAEQQLAERDVVIARVRALAEHAMKLPTLEDPRPANDHVSPRAVLAALSGSADTPPAPAASSADDDWERMNREDDRRWAELIAPSADTPTTEETTDAQ